ncbi:hypothetical protein LTR09_012390 [Extremus antarcticus]|uniref:Methyltransferase n=1 Tax=Extremus antarcticus TaxID=702011 RepID=A0AAJ0DA54_9PEZI|nr:hypothetical protein LTR09_012390 [Extremus antarcticus]
MSSTLLILLVTTDLSPTQPPWVPPNCFFSIDDVELAWTFPDSHFDFVHIRCLMGSIKDWPALYRQAYDHISPGGWIQHLDMDLSFISDDGTVGDDHLMAQWSKALFDAGEVTGKTFNVPNRMSRLIQDAGFEDMQQVWYKIPVRGWTKDKLRKEVGKWNYHYCLQGCEGWALLLLNKVLQWRMEEIQDFIAKFKDALGDKKNHAYYNILANAAQSPPLAGSFNCFTVFANNMFDNGIGDGPFVKATSTNSRAVGVVLDTTQMRADIIARYDKPKSLLDNLEASRTKKVNC